MLLTRKYCTHPPAVSNYKLCYEISIYLGIAGHLTGKMNDVIRIPFIFFWMRAVIFLTLICTHCARSRHRDMLICT